MSRKPYFVAAVLILGVLLVALWGSASAQEKAKEKPAAAKVRWEYKVVAVGLARTEELFNELGQEGWELVTVLAGEKGGIQARAFFKRPLAEPAKKEAAPPK